jgi:hypothetical protein
MKRKNCLVNLFIVALVLLPVIARAELQTIQKAQPIQKTPQNLQPAQAVKAEVKSASTRSLKLEPGGKTATITIQGDNLNKINDYRVLLGNRLVKDIEVTLGPSSTKTRRVSLKAKATAKPQENYTLQLLAGKEIIEVPLTLEVVSPTVAQTPATPLGSPPEQPQPTPAPLPGQNQPEPQNNPTEPAHPAYQTTPVHGMEVERAEEEPLIPLQMYDFRFTHVEGGGNPLRLSIYFRSGEVNGRIYNGPLTFKIEVGGQWPTTQTVTMPDASFTIFDVQIDSLQSYSYCCVPVTIWINSDGAVPEINQDNNRYEGIFCEGTGVQFSFFQTYVGGETRQIKIFDRNFACGDRVVFYPSNFEGKPYYDPNTPDCLYATSEVRIKNCSKSGKDVTVQFKYISYDRERVEQQQIHLGPGEYKTVSAGTILKIRKRGNYVEVKLFTDGIERDSCRFDLEFRDFPWF